MPALRVRGKPVIVLVAQQANARSCSGRDVAAAVGRAVVDHQQLEVGEGLRQDALDRVAEIRLAVVDRDDDADPRRSGAAARVICAIPSIGRRPASGRSRCCYGSPPCASRLQWVRPIPASAAPQQLGEEAKEGPPQHHARIPAADAQRMAKALAIRSASPAPASARRAPDTDGRCGGEPGRRAQTAALHSAAR